MGSQSVGSRSPNPHRTRHRLAEDQSLTFSQKDLATGKYGCRKVLVCPAECGEQLGRNQQDTKEYLNQRGT